MDCALVGEDVLRKRREEIERKRIERIEREKREKRERREREWREKKEEEERKRIARETLRTTYISAFPKTFSSKNAGRTWEWSVESREMVDDGDKESDASEKVLVGVVRCTGMLSEEEKAQKELEATRAKEEKMREGIEEEIDEEEALIRAVPPQVLPSFILSPSTDGTKMMFSPKLPFVNYPLISFHPTHVECEVGFGASPLKFEHPKEGFVACQEVIKQIQTHTPPHFGFFLSFFDQIFGHYLSAKKEWEEDQAFQTKMYKLACMGASGAMFSSSSAKKDDAKKSEDPEHKKILRQAETRAVLCQSCAFSGRDKCILCGKYAGGASSEPAKRCSSCAFGSKFDQCNKCGKTCFEKFTLARLCSDCGFMKYKGKCVRCNGTVY
ncbi:hypothetical protein ADUPG1_010221 [Aduncisulcus paluster]|uniref:Uncharacterized protein n=1 Tax=Aduncisulcus paluster TaxID=2918883 RepID=A0ABQ5JQE8_9EUKA|nr:hypothetical protein ADUPG1_010221 [Aduncisulcus paluster]